MTQDADRVQHPPSSDDDQDALKASEAKFRALFENSRDALFIADAKSGILIDVNEAACRLLERTKDELIGLHQSEIHERGKAEAYQELFRRHVEEGKSFDQDLYVKTKSGKLIPVDIAAAVLEIDSRRVIYGAFRDVTERKRLQEEIIRTERLSAIGQIATGIAHEFNNLHCAIQGHLDLIMRNPDLAPADRDRLEVIKKASERAEAITRQLLAFSRQRRPQRHPRNLAEEVDETLKILQSELGAQEITVTTRHEDLPSIVMDPVQIGQVVMDLTINAIHAMTGCKSKKLDVETGRGGDRVFIRVSDTGRGIAETDRSLIFEPFFTTKGSGGAGGIGGTGLGLSVCDMIAKEHGGEITVKSRVGEGSVFTLWLPMLTELPGETLSASVQTQELAGTRVLLVDDDLTVCRLVREALEGRKCFVDVARTATQGVYMALEGGYDIVLVDVQISDMRAENILTRINEIPESERPVKLILTEEADAFERFEEFDVFDVLLKPLTPIRLCDRIAAAARQRAGNTK
ncbi:MAG: PAS domain S-box protein [Planctomycetes bacterium]|nr:PAS domain S-box protein [Planctomycetota bacterium]